jgi:dehydrogenase/reductase SDR family member 7
VVEETEMQVAHEIMSLNAAGAMDVGRAFLPILLQQGSGRLVPIASMAARVPSPGQAEYAAAKHALIGYFASVAAEVAGRGVGVTIACPGPIAGADVRSVFGAQGRMDKVEDDSSQKKKVPLRRCCELICRAAAYGVQEAWIARNPVLVMGYLTRYLPDVSEAILKKIGPKRARALREGKSGYSYDLAGKSE